MVKLITSNVGKEFQDLLNTTKKEIKIICPFFGKNTSIKLAEIINENNLEAKIITRFSRHDFFCKASSLEGLKKLINSGAKLKAVKNLHTKLYIFDDKNIILGSSNYSRGGLFTNLELNVLINDENEIIKRATDYYNEIDLCIENDYQITEEMIDNEMNILSKIVKTKDNFFDERNDRGKYLEIQKKDDFIEQIINPNDEKSEKTSAWIKFEGFSGENRTKNDERIIININDNGCYRTYFPKKPTGYKNGDIIFIARNSWDHNGNKTPIIFGYGITKKYEKENVATEEEKKENKNLVRWPYYINVEKFKYINTTLYDGISLLDVYKDVGSDTYPGSKKRNSTFNELKKIHSQKDKLQITDETKEYLLNKLSNLIKNV